MAKLVVLHIGLMKSGTTFLQGRLRANRDALARQDVLFPGPSWARQVRAVSDLMGSKKRKRGAWKDLVREVNAHRGTAVISMEYLGPAGPGPIAKAARSFTGAELRVVATVRDLGRSVPAMWQESVKNRQTWTWGEYLKALESGGEPATRFWRQQDSARILRRWSDGVGVDRAHLITIPPPGAPAETLWERFSAVCGIAPDSWEEAPRANESLGAASTLVLRQVNLATTEFSSEQYKQRVKALGKHVLSQHRRQEDPIGFTVPPWLREESARIRRDLESLGVPVTGDLDELEPLDVPGVDPGGVGEGAQLEAAVAGLASVLKQVQKINR